MQPSTGSINTDNNRMYLVRSDHAYGIVAGKCRGKQALLAGTQEGLLQIEFDGTGNFTGTHLYPFSGRDPYDMFDQVAAELGFAEEPIKVKSFFLTMYNIGIYALSSALREYVAHPERYSHKEQELNEEDLQAWLSAGYYSLLWRQEFFMDSNGEVISS